MFFDVIMWNNALPLDDGEDVVAIQTWNPEDARRSETTMADFERWRARMSTLRDVGAFRTTRKDVTFPDGNVDEISVAEMSAAGFRTARVAPLLGRTYSAEESSTNSAPVVVIGHDEWQSRFAGRSDVIGDSIRIGDALHTIVGVMPAAFGFPVNHQYWVPLTAAADELLPAPPAGAVFARLDDGESIESAQAQLSAVGLIPSADAQARAEPLRLTIVRYANNFVSDTDPQEISRRNWNARLVMIFVCLLLIPPCANIAMLVYARSVMRQEEIAIRTALGASRMRIVAQLFIEMLVLTTIAAVLALTVISALSFYYERLMLRGLERLPFWISFDLSLNAVLFAATLATACALATGLLPAMQATRNFARPGLSALDPRNRLRLGALWTTLAVAQIAFSFAALPTAVEMAWGTLRPHALGPGFEAGSYLTARISLDLDEDASQSSEDVAERFATAQRTMISALERETVVESRVTETSLLPGQGGQGAWQRLGFEEDAVPEGSIQLQSTVTIGAPLGRRTHIDDAWFDTLDTLLLSGRTFESNEYGSDTLAVVVNETFSDAYFPDENPLGRRFRYLPSAQLQGAGAPVDEAWYEIVGVTADRPAYAEGPTIFHPTPASRPSRNYLLFRTGPDAAALRARLSSIAESADPQLRVSEVRSLAELYYDQAIGNYLGSAALIIASIAVLLLSAAGLYSLMSFTVNQRQREIGIRLALGAKPQRLLAGIFRRALRQTGLGALIGLLVAALINEKIPARTLGGWDLPGVLPAAALLMIAIGIIAAWGPARRTLSVSPSRSLKQD